MQCGISESLSFAFTWWQMMLNISLSATCHSRFLYWEFYLGLYPIFNFFLAFNLCSLLSFDITPLLVVGLVKIFSQFVACCFVLVLVSCALLKLFIFKRSPLSTVDLKAWVTGVLFKKFCSVPIRSRALPTLLLLHSVYLVLCWCPGSILCRVIITINLILLYVHCQLDQHHLLKMLFFHTV